MALRAETGKGKCMRREQIETEKEWLSQELLYKIHI